MTRQYDSRQDRSVDLVDTVWKVCMQWKAVLIVMLICGLAFSFRMYKKSIATYMTQMQMAEMSEEELVEEMGKDDYKKVVNAVKNQIDSEQAREYQDNSILLKQHPHYERKLCVEYKLYTGNGTAEAVADMYRELASGDELVKRIAKVMNYDGDLVYIRELIKTSFLSADDNLSVLDLTMILSDDMDAGAIAKEIDAYFDEKSKADAQNGNAYTITKVLQQESRVNDIELANLISSVQSNINTYNAAVENFDLNATDSQKKLYKGMLAKEHEKLGIEDEQEEETTPAAPTFSKLYVIIGALIGVILYACAALGYAIIRPTVASTVNIIDTYGLYLIEEFHGKTFGGFKDFVFGDKLLYRLRHYGEAKNLEQSVASAKAQVVNLAAKENVDKICICEMAKKKSAGYTAYVDGLTKSIEEAGLSAEVVAEADVKARIIVLDDKTGIIFVTCEGRTTYRDMDMIRGNAAKYHIPMLGVVALDG